MRKGVKHATIPLAPRTSRAIDLYVGERATGPIFLGAKGGRMDRYAADGTVKHLARRAGITKRISPHCLRHSFVTDALDAGVALRDVQEAASHTDPRTTMRYDRRRALSTATPPTSSPRSLPEPPADRRRRQRYRAPMTPGTAGCRAAAGDLREHPRPAHEGDGVRFRHRVQRRAFRDSA